MITKMHIPARPPLKVITASKRNNQIKINLNMNTFLLFVIVSFLIVVIVQLHLLHKAVISTSNQAIIYYAHPEMLDKAIEKEK
jgi:hypothetical protein